MENSTSFDAFNEIEHLVSDISNKNVSEYGKNAILDGLVSTMQKHKSELDKVLGYVNALEKRCKLFEEKIETPLRRENEFKDVAKKLNFPDLSPVSDGDVKNPNAEVPFEDPVPENDITYIKSKIDRFDKNSVDDVVLQKDEQLTTAEISAYTNEENIAKLAKKEMDIVKAKPNLIKGIINNASNVLSKDGKNSKKSRNTKSRKKQSI